MSANGLTYEHGARYLVRPTRWGLTESKEKKTPQFYITAEVLGQIDPQNPDGELWQAPQGNALCFWFLTENAVDNLIRDLADMGYDRPDLTGLDPSSPNAFDFSRLELRMSCTHEQYNNKWRERWQYGVGSGFNPLPLEQKQVAQLNALFGSRFKKLAQPKQGSAPAGNGRGPALAPQRQPQTAAQRAVNSVAPPHDEDIPF